MRGFQLHFTENPSRLDVNGAEAIAEFHARVIVAYYYSAFLCGNIAVAVGKNVIADRKGFLHFYAELVFYEGFNPPVMVALGYDYFLEIKAAEQSGKQVELVTLGKKGTAFCPRAGLSLPAQFF